jgi:hypothetical protein
METYTYPARTTVAAFGTVTEVKDTAENTLYVLKKCLKAGYNDCVVTAELVAHNDARLARKDAPALTHDSKASVKIQELLNANAATYAAETKYPNLASKTGGTFAKCIQSVYKGAYTAGKGTTEWLKGSTVSASLTAGSSATDKALAYAFRELLWKNAKTVGFGQKGTHLVAWYCASPAPDLSALVDKSDYDALKSCETGTGPLLYNTCFNKAAIDESNTLRAQHKVAKFD